MKSSPREAELLEQIDRLCERLLAVSTETATLRRLVLSMALNVPRRSLPADERAALDAALDIEP